MKILYDEDRGYYLDKCCSCHEVSSFEAKTMDILDQLGITYIREKSFDGLVGDSGRGLRFDFVLSKSADTVSAGDVIEWNYTCDLGCDLPNGDPYGYGKEWKDNHD